MSVFRVILVRIFIAFSCIGTEYGEIRIREKCGSEYLQIQTRFTLWLFAFRLTSNYMPHFSSHCRGPSKPYQTSKMELIAKIAKCIFKDFSRFTFCFEWRRAKSLIICFLRKVYACSKYPQPIKLQDSSIMNYWGSLLWLFARN